MGLRRSFSGHQLVMNGGEFCGVELGADACADHEFGIAGIRDHFGVQGKPTPDKLGADARTVTQVPDNLRLLELGGNSYLLASWIFNDFDPEEEDAIEWLHRRIGIWDDEQPFHAAWDKDGFAMALLNDTEGHLSELHEAFRQLDVIIFQRSQPFTGGVPTMYIRSKIPQEHLDQLAASDRAKLEEVEQVE